MTQNRLSLILLPGLLCDAALWRHQATYLSDLTEPAVMDLTRDNRIEAMAARVLAEAPERFALAGLSMGGYVALEVIRQAPERVAGLALMDTHPRADKPEQSEQRRQLMDLARNDRFEQILPKLLPRMIHGDRQQDKPLIAELKAMAERVGPAAFIRQQEAIIQRQDYRSMLATIRCPVTVIGGSGDLIAPLSWMTDMAEAIPGANLAIIEDCGHMSTMEQPQATTALMRSWLQRLGDAH